MTAPAHLRLDATGSDAARFDATSSGASASATARGGRAKGGRGAKQQVAPSSDDQPAGSVSARSQYARTNGTLAGSGTSRQTSTEDEGSDFQSILRKFSSSQTDEEDASQESAGDGSQTQSGSDSGAASSGSASSGTTASTSTAAATAPTDEAATANEIPPFMLAIPRSRETTSSDAAPSTGSSRGAASAQSTGLNSMGLLMGLGQEASGTAATGTNSDEVDPDADRSGGSLANAQLAAAAPQIASDGAAAQRGELAFAAKLIVNTGDSATPAGASSGTEQPLQQALQKSTSSTSSMSTMSSAASISSAAASTADAGTSALNEKIAGAGPADLAAKPTAMFQTESIGGHAGSSFRMDSGAQSSGTPANTMPASARLAESIELPRAVPASPSDITVRIPDSARGTDVRFVERAGEVHVSVRTSDSGMAQTLRSGLNDFAARLEHGGIKAEMWRPSSENNSGSSSQNQYGRRPGDQRGSQGEQSGGADSQDSNPNSKKPKWVEALEMSIGRQA